MEHSTAVFRVTILVWICVSRCAAEHPKVQGSLPNISLTNIVDYVRPYIRALRLGQETESGVGKTNTSAVEHAIDAKIKELLPFFQDDDVSEIDKDKIIKQGDEETTIIEFIPKSHNNVKKLRNEDKESETVKTGIRKYKNLRNKIKLALEKEMVATKTKKMVTKTLDELIAQLLSSQCKWDESNNLRGSYLNSLILNADFGCYFNSIKLTDTQCRGMIQNLSEYGIHLFPSSYKWEKNFENVKNQTKNVFYELAKSFLNLRRDSQTTNPLTRYQLRCEVVDMNKVRARTGLRRKGNCQDFRICSEELKEFLRDFYKSLNDTAVSAFRNYAAMYVRDVNTDDSEEKNAVTTTIKNVSDAVEGRVSKVFIKQVSKIRLDDNKNSDTNIDAIKEYVRTTVRHINKKIKKHLEADLRNLRARLLIAVKEDIIVNLDVDLGNTESMFLGTICKFFVTCNGAVTGSLRKGYQSSQNNVKSSSVYVKVQLSLDDEIEDSFTKNVQKLQDSKGADFSKQNSKLFDNFKAIVTRTTLKYIDLTTKVGADATLQDSDQSETDTSM